MSTIRAVKGMPDILPENIYLWQYLEKIVTDLAQQYAYKEIRFPIVESTALFKRAVGEVTDIVEKEMYTFADRNNESLSLRPEGTAGCVRACIQNGLLRQNQRLWYKGQMFRYERPQKGRQRQFHQIGLEAFGWQTPDVDAELILLSAQLWQQLGISEHVKLEINSLGCKASRATHKKDLLAFLTEHKDQLDEDSLRRLDSNPLRILDSKNASVQALVENAPQLIDYLDETSQKHFDSLCAMLNACGVEYTINPRLVRGLDYYNMTVFEWVTDALGAQGTVCAGGRYDSLVEQLGGKAVPAVGMAMGLERLCLLLEALNCEPEIPSQCDVYVLLEDDDAIRQSVYATVQMLRNALPDIRILLHCGGGSFKSQMKKADKSGAAVALIIGETEFEQQKIAMKGLRKDTAFEQVLCEPQELLSQLKQFFY